MLGTWNVKFMKSLFPVNFSTKCLVAFQLIGRDCLLWSAVLLGKQQTRLLPVKGGSTSSPNSPIRSLPRPSSVMQNVLMPKVFFFKHLNYLISKLFLTLWFEIHLIKGNDHKCYLGHPPNQCSKSFSCSHDGAIRPLSNMLHFKETSVIDIDISAFEQVFFLR